MAAIIQVSRQGESADTNHLNGLGLQPWIVVFTAALFFFYEFIQMTMFNSINLELMAAFHINATQISELSANYFYANVLFLIPAGLLLDRFSTKRLLLIAMGTCIASNFLFASTSNFHVAEACRFLTGMGSTFCLLSCVHLASRWFPARRLALVSGLIVTMAMLGGVVGQTPFTMLAQVIHWRWTIVVSAVFGIIFWLLILRFVKDCPSGFKAHYHDSKRRSHELGLLNGIGAAVKNFQNWAAGIYTNILSLPVILLGALWVSPFLQKVSNLTPQQASNVSTMIFFGMIVGSPLMGWFSDMICRRKWPMIVGGILSLANVLVIIYVKHLTYVPLLLLFFSLGVFSSSQVISYALIPESNPRLVTATALSLSATLIMSAGAIFQPLFGLLMDQSGDYTVQAGVRVYGQHAYYYAMGILPITFMLALLMACLVRETYGRYTKE